MSTSREDIDMSDPRDDVVAHPRLRQRNIIVILIAKNTNHASAAHPSPTRAGD
jgi:hypothetical protein